MNKTQLFQEAENIDNNRLFSNLAQTGIKLRLMDSVVEPLRKFAQKSVTRAISSSKQASKSGQDVKDRYYRDQVHKYGRSKGTYGNKKFSFEPGYKKVQSEFPKHVKDLEDKGGRQ